MKAVGKNLSFNKRGRGSKHLGIVDGQFEKTNPKYYFNI